MASHFKKREGWWGVAVTVLLCGGFLWWWFQPAPVDGRTERDPLFWLDLARKELGPAQPPASACFDSLAVALSYQQAGKDSIATAIANDWLPSAWISALAAPAEANGDGGLTIGFAADAAFPPVFAKLTEARDLLDQLEVERGQAVFHEAIGIAGALTAPERDQALWLVAARQARSGFAPDARRTRQRIHPGTEVGSLPAWLMIELIHADMAAPVLAWWELHPAGSSQVLNEVVAVLRDRLLHRESGELAGYGPRADPTSTHPADDVALLTIHQAVETNQLRSAGETARQFPRGSARAAAYLAIARTLAWNSERPRL